MSQQFAPAYPKRRMSAGAIVAITLGSVAVVVLIAVGVVFLVRGSSASASTDATVSACHPLSQSATVAITNSGGSAASYVVTVAFTSPDGGTQYETATARAVGLAPGQSTSVDATAASEAPNNAVCKVVTVTRS